MTRIRAILFDLDNTLLDFLLLKKEACKAVVDAMIKTGLRMDREKAWELLMKTYLEVGLDSNIVFTMFLDSYGRNDPESKSNMLNAGLNAYKKVKPKYLVPYPSVVDTLSSLKKSGLYLAVVTDAPKEKAEERLSSIEVIDYFEFVLGRESRERMKVTGLPFTFAFERLKRKYNELADLSESQVLVVGDSVERDILPAQKLGFKTALAEYGQVDGLTVNADYFLKNFGELSELF